jgi:hypothetical protein
LPAPPPPRLQHLDDILALKPACVWLQSGIRCFFPYGFCALPPLLSSPRPAWLARVPALPGAPSVSLQTPLLHLVTRLSSARSHPEVEERLAAAGIKVVPSRCLKVDRAAAGGRAAL